MQTSLSHENLKPWKLWLGLGVVFFLAYGILEMKEAALRDTLTWILPVLQAAAGSLCCAFTCLGSMGFARTLFKASWPPADSFSANAYGVYVFHYIFITWTQFCLLTVPIPAALKFLITFCAAMAAGWGLTALLRRTIAGKVL
jgi:hypothetical protein